MRATVVVIPPRRVNGRRPSQSRRKTGTVRKVIVRRTYSLVRLEGGVTLRLSRYVYLRKGDKLEFSPSVAKPVTIRKRFVDKATGQVAHVIVFPPYQGQEVIRIPPHAIAVTFKERTSPVEWRAAKVLERFHYRGKGFNRLVGRRIVMLAISEEFGVLA